MKQFPKTGPPINIPDTMKYIKNSKYTKYDINYRLDVSLCMRVGKEIIKKKTMKGKNVK